MVRYRRPLHRWEWAALLGVLWLAAALRLGAPGVTEFKRDEAALSRLSLELAQGERFPWLGIGSSVGFPNTPISVYLFAIPYALGNNPIIATLFVGLLNLLAVALTWKLARRYFGPQAALFAALFYAVSPWAILYSRKIWAQDLLPPFVTATVFTGLLGFLEPKPKRWAQALHLFLLAVTVQIHFGAATLIPISLLMLWLGRANLRREFWLSVGAAALASLPFLYGLADSDLLSLSAVRDSLDRSAEGDGQTSAISDTALEYAWFTLAGQDIHSLAGARQFQRYLDGVPDAYPLFNLLPIGVILSAAWLAMRAYRRREQAKLVVVLLAWLGAPVLAFSVRWTTVHPHYFIPMMPAAFILLGAGAARVLKNLTPRPPLHAGEGKSQGQSLLSALEKGLRSEALPLRPQRVAPLRFAILALTAGVAVLQVWLVVALFDFLNTHNTGGAFGTPLCYLLEVRGAIVEAKPSSVVVVSDSDSVAYDSEPAVWDVLLDDIPEVRYLNADYQWIIPAQPALMLMTPAVDETRWLDWTAAPPAETFTLRPREGEYRLWESLALRLPEDRTQVEARFANGASLESLWRTADTIWLVWRLPAAQPGVAYTVFVHGLDASGQRVAQADLPFWAGDYWRVGDQVIVRADLPRDAAQTLSIGMYRLVGENEYRNSELLDAEGRYLGQSFTLPVREIRTR